MHRVAEGVPQDMNKRNKPDACATVVGNEDILVPPAHRDSLCHQRTGMAEKQCSICKGQIRIATVPTTQAVPPAAPVLAILLQVPGMVSYSSCRSDPVSPLCAETAGVCWRIKCETKGYKCIFEVQCAISYSY